MKVLENFVLLNVVVLLFVFIFVETASRGGKDVDILYHVVIGWGIFSVVLVTVWFFIRRTS